MKLSAAAVLAASCCSARLTAATIANVYTYDPTEESRPQSQTLSPVAARVVLAQRAGVEAYHQSSLEDEDVIDAINTLGVRTPLFDASERDIGRAVLLIPDELQPSSTKAFLYQHLGFQLNPAPAVSAIRELYIDLARQTGPGHHDLSDDEAYERLQAGSFPTSENIHFRACQSAAEAEIFFDELVKSQAWSITVLATVADENAAHGAEQQPILPQWGSYEMPGLQSPLRKRQQREKPLTETHSYKAAASSAGPVSSYATSEPLTGILPACYASLASCERNTRNCTGHGACSLKYHDSTAGSQASSCYSCECVATRSSDGLRTTYWAGPACQKKDVSVQFWLFALFTVGLIFLVGFAIGQIVEMGNQELPSVIGAGVSGPTARK